MEALNVNVVRVLTKWLGFVVAIQQTNKLGSCKGTFVNVEDRDRFLK